MKDGFPRGKTAIVGAATLASAKRPGTTPSTSRRMPACGAGQAGPPKPRRRRWAVHRPADDYLSGLSLPSTWASAPKITDNNRTGGSAFLHARVLGRARTRDRAVRRRADRLRQQPAQRRGQAGQLAEAAGLRGALQAPAPVSPTRWPPRATCTSTAPRASSWRDGRRGAQWAQLNPAAFSDAADGGRGAGARMVSRSADVRDCCLVTDGAAARW
jgi:hypothetical protein